MKKRERSDNIYSIDKFRKADQKPADQDTPKSSSPAMRQVDDASLPYAFNPGEIDRGGPCPCGSGKAYLKCHGVGDVVYPIEDADLFAYPATGHGEDTEPSLEQWARIYEYARVLRKLQPWYFLWDTDLISIMLPGRIEPVFLSITGRMGECYSIAIYPGYESLHSYMRLTEANADESALFYGLEMKCLLCYFGDREELSDKDRKMIQSLGIRFRGRNEWIYFRTVEPGYIPWYIRAGQADFLAQVLEQLAILAESFPSGALSTEMAHDETILRFYSQEKKAWINTTTQIPPIPIREMKVDISDDLLITDLRKASRTNVSIAIENVFLPTPITKGKGHCPYYPRLLLLMELSSGFVADQRIMGDQEPFYPMLLEMLIHYIKQYDLPASVHVRDYRTYNILENFCEKIEVELVIDNEIMEKMHELLSGLLDSMDAYGVFDGIFDK